MGPHPPDRGRCAREIPFRRSRSPSTGRNGTRQPAQTPATTRQRSAWARQLLAQLPRTLVQSDHPLAPAAPTEQLRGAPTQQGTALENLRRQDCTLQEHITARKASSSSKQTSPPARLNGKAPMTQAMFRQQRLAAIEGTEEQARQLRREADRAVKAARSPQCARHQLLPTGLTTRRPTQMKSNPQFPRLRTMRRWRKSYRQSGTATQ